MFTIKLFILRIVLHSIGFVKYGVVISLYTVLHYFVSNSPLFPGMRGNSVLTKDNSVRAGEGGVSEARQHAVISVMTPLAILTTIPCVNSCYDTPLLHG